jgi:hypothetical protein
MATSDDPANMPHARPNQRLAGHHLGLLSEGTTWVPSDQERSTSPDLNRKCGRQQADDGDLYTAANSLPKGPGGRSRSIEEQVRYLEDRVQRLENERRGR